MWFIITFCAPSLPQTLQILDPEFFRSLLVSPNSIKKTYMTENLMSKVRQIFLTRVKLQPFAGNFKADKRFAKTEWLCRCGWEIEQESHLVSGECPVYGDLVTLLEDKGDDKELLTFFTAHCAHPESSTQTVAPRSFYFLNLSMSLS